MIGNKLEATLKIGENSGEKNEFKIKGDGNTFGIPADQISKIIESAAKNNRDVSINEIITIVELIVDKKIDEKMKSLFTSGNHLNSNIGFDEKRFKDVLRKVNFTKNDFDKLIFKEVRDAAWQDKNELLSYINSYDSSLIKQKSSTQKFHARITVNFDDNLSKVANEYLAELKESDLKYKYFDQLEEYFKYSEYDRNHALAVLISVKEGKMNSQNVGSDFKDLVKFMIQIEIIEYARGTYYSYTPISIKAENELEELKLIEEFKKRFNIIED